LIENVEKAKVLWTRMLQNSWSSGSCFEEVVSTEARALRRLRLR